MEQLRDIFDNMQTAQAGEGGGGESPASAAGRALRSLDNMIRNQQRLRDETFRQNNELAEGGGPGQGGEAGNREDLPGRQQALRRQLERLQQGLTQQGLSGEPGFDAAERAMRDAEERLAEGDGEEPWMRRAERFRRF